MTNLNARKVCRFRTNIDPMIGPKPRNAFDARELTNWSFEMTPAGIYVKAVFAPPGGGQTRVEEHVVPYANCQSIMLSAEEEAEETSPKKK